jgi:hypothetical protein
MECCIRSVFNRPVTPVKLRYPAFFGAGQVGVDMRTLSNAEHLAAAMASFVYSFPATVDEQLLNNWPALSTWFLLTRWLCLTATYVKQNLNHMDTAYHGRPNN